MDGWDCLLDSSGAINRGAEGEWGSTIVDRPDLQETRKC